MLRRGLSLGAVTRARTAPYAQATKQKARALSKKQPRARVEIGYEEETTGPPHWQEVHAGIVRMREAREAPVDSMGAETCHDVTTSPATQRFQTLVALMLSSQTKDELTSATMRRLREHGLTIQSILDTDGHTLEQLIYPCSFYRNKARYIKKTAEILRCDFKDDIPNTINGLTALPGVGPKMGHLAMQIAWKQLVGIGVDVHVHRICNRLGWAKTRTPEETRVALEAWLPREYWGSINILLVGFGQTICASLRPNCHVCEVATLCPTGRKTLRKKT